MQKKLVTLVVDCDIAPAHSGDSIYVDEQLLGTVTSGAYGHRINKNIAYAFVSPQIANIGTQVSVQILGDRYPAVVTETCLYDPANELVKS